MRLSPFKWVSLALGAVTFAAVAALMLYMIGPAWTQSGGSHLDIVLAASFVGVLVWGLLWIVAGAFDTELHRAVVMSREASSDRGANDLRLRGPFGLRHVLDAWSSAHDAMRVRLKEATLARRDLEVGLATAQSQRTYLESVLQAVDDAVLVTDSFNEVVLANRAAADLLGFTLDAIARKPVDQVCKDQTLVRLIRDAREAARVSPQLRRQVQHRVAGRAGATVYGVTLRAITGQVDIGGVDGGTPACAGVITVLRDVTQQVETAARRSDFVASVSHELRTPLASIKGCLEMLVDGEATDAASRSEFYNIIQTETNRLSRLVDNILNISRIESGLAQARRDRVDLATVVDEAVSAVAPQARAKRLRVSWTPASEAAFVTADRDMMVQVMHNLLGNAIKYTPDGGSVEVALGIDHGVGSVSVSVKDSGIGIPADALPYVFDKFYRVADHTRVAKGTGLGLNLVKHVVEGVHGGRVTATSEVGRGSVFTFVLPTTDDRPLTAGAPELVSVGSTQGNGGGPAA